MNTFMRIGLLGLLATLSSLAQAQSASTEDFTGTSTSNNWYYFNGACLTAGTGVSNASNGTVAGPVPGCKNILGYYVSKGDAILNGGYSDIATTNHTTTWSDNAGYGALRFTNGSYDGNNGGKNQNGAIVSSTPFDAGAGVSITFKTVTYRGNGSGSTGDGADGLSFYLIDASNFQPVGGTKPWNGIGAFGGSLAYTCSNANSPHDGLNGGYLGLGIDEYGNFLNGVNLTSTTSPGGYVGSATGDNTASGYGFVPQRIGLRGAGSVSWSYLTYTYPTYYPSTLNATQQQTAVQKTCQTGQVWNYGANAGNPPVVPNPSPALYDYAAIPDAFSVLPAKTIAGEWRDNVFNRQQARPIFYKLTITQDGLLSLAYALNGSPAYTSIINNRSISSTNALSALPARLYFGFAGSTGGSSNIHEIMCFKAAPSTTSSTSAAVSQQLATKIQGGSQVYFSYYNPNDWTGNITANGLVDTAGVLSINTLANWDGQCNLTNSATCNTVGAAPPSTATTTDSTRMTSTRQILTWNASTADASSNAGTAAVALSWGNLTNSQQAQLAAGDDTTTAQLRLDYYYGSKAKEINTSGVGLFRARNGVLGDIIDSSPAWVGPPTSPYSQTWTDRYLPTWQTTFTENTGQTYQSFKNVEAARLNVVYVGANDGMLHAFQSGRQDATGAVVSDATTPNDGKEILAYMPGYVLNIIHPYSTDPSTEAALSTLDYANSRYAHAFFVDGPPGTGDLFYGGYWHTWLMSGIGLGGADVFALDITNPSATAVSTNPSSPPAFSNSSAPNPAVVIGEWSANSISCVNVSNCGRNLGNVVGQPLFRKLHNGNWGVIFGNGFGSQNGDAGIFIMNVNVSSGAKSFYYLSTSTGSSASPNGIAYVTAADFDGDHITDYVYAGDLQGNVWRFDLTACSPTGTTAATCPSWAQGSWGVTPGPLFRTATGQPITTPIVLATAAIQGTDPSVILTFGTGQRKQFTNGTATNPFATPSGTSYASCYGAPASANCTNVAQSLYGVWDWNFSKWNSHSTFTNLSLVAATGNSTDQTGLNLAAPVLGRGNLTSQSYSTGTTAGTIKVQSTAISWRTCGATGNDQTGCSGSSYGWYADLPNANEQIVSVPNSFAQAVTVNSTIPADNGVLSCTANTDQGVTYVFSPLTGGTFTNTSGTATSAFVNNFGQTNMVGLQSNETGGLTVVNTVENTTWLVGQSVAPSPGQPPAQPIPVTLPPNVTINRKTWVQLR